MGAEMIQIAGVAIIGTVIAVLMRQYKPEYAAAVGLITALLILGIAFQWIEPLVERLQEIIEGSGLPVEYGEIVLKALGICVLAQFATDTCRDAGETAIASKVEFAAKLAVLWIALPLFDRLLSIAMVLIGG